MEKKITLATIKSFIKKNRNGLFINVKSDFNGMTDCVEDVKGGFKKITPSTNENKYNLGISGAWFVGGSRDYFTAYSDDFMVGYEIYNSCGSFILAFQK